MILLFQTFIRFFLFSDFEELSSIVGLSALIYSLKITVRVLCAKSIIVIIPLNLLVFHAKNDVFFLKE